MIVKIRTVDDGWMFCSGTTIKSRPLTKEQYKFGISSGTPQHIHINEKELYGSDGAIFVKVVNIDCGKTIIYTNLCVYLLNDEGKTIERLN